MINSTEEMYMITMEGAGGNKFNLTEEMYMITGVGGGGDKLNQQRKCT